MGIGSLSYKIGNFRAIDGQGNVDGYSLQAIRMSKRYSVLPDEEVRTAGQEAVARALRKQLDNMEAELAQKKPQAKA